MVKMFFNYMFYIISNVAYMCKLIKIGQLLLLLLLFYQHNYNALSSIFKTLIMNWYFYYSFSKAKVMVEQGTFSALQSMRMEEWSPEQAIASNRLRSEPVSVVICFLGKSSKELDQYSWT